jgi:ATP-dependent protease ClpP protease subunit
MDSAIRAYSFLKGLPVEVTTIGFGQVDSAAVTIFLAGKKRQALKGCRFFLHEGTFTVGNPVATLSAHKETMSILTNLLERNVEIIAHETTKSKDDVVAAIQRSPIFSAQDAKEFGIVQEIIEKLPFGAATATASRGQGGTHTIGR